MRFNDTLKIQLEDPSPFGGRRPTTVKFSKVAYEPASPVPVSRTYHASCLLRNFMIVIGGEALTDLKDFWALDLDSLVWRQPPIQYLQHYTAKRFHSASAIGDSKVVTFGGCHGEYVHLNEIHLFDLSGFLECPSDLTR
jgi:Galactose oxidase, central domain